MSAGGARPIGLVAQAFGGAEVSLGPRVDLYGLVPLSFLVGGWPVREFESGAPGTIQSYTAPRETSPVAVGVELGISVRLFGVKVDHRSTDFGADDFDL